MENVTISYLNICEILIDNNSDIDVTVEVIANSNEGMTAEDVEVFTGFLKKNFFTKFKDRWQKARRIKTRFLDLNENWLKNVYKVCKYAQTMKHQAVQIWLNVDVQQKPSRIANREQRGQRYKIFVKKKPQWC